MSDVDFIKKLNPLGAFYSISKTLIEKQVLSFGEKYGVDVVCLNHAWVLGPFVTPHCPQVVHVSMAMILGSYFRYLLWSPYQFLVRMSHQ